MRAAFIRLYALLVLASIVTLAAPASACGQVEVEADPIAYILNGHSGHLAYTHPPARLSAGVFKADPPHFFHGHEGWDVRSQGVTVKLDYLLPAMRGLFVGLDAGYQRDEYAFESASEIKTQDQFRLGVRTGYRFFAPKHRFLRSPLGERKLFAQRR